MDTDPDSLLSILFLLAFPTSEVLFGVFTIALLLLASALISGSEVAFFSLTENDLEKLESDNNRSSDRILFLKEHPKYHANLVDILVGDVFKPGVGDMFAAMGDIQPKLPDDES